MDSFWEKRDIGSRTIEKRQSHFFIGRGKIMKVTLFYLYAKDTV